MKLDNMITLVQVQNGAPGQDGDKYYIETNTEEFLGYYDNYGFHISPVNLSLKIQNSSTLSWMELKDRFNFEYVKEDGSTETLLLPEYQEFYSLEEDKLLNYSLDALIESEGKIFPKSTIFKFTYVEDGKAEAVKVFSYREGLNPNTAEFNIQAGAIVSAVGSSLMEFTNSGLNIYNSGLAIYNQKENSEENPRERLFEVNEGNLFVKGEIHATSGTFSGTIEATEGKIGGFNLFNDRMESEGIVTVTEDGREVTKPAITIDGINGKITAHAIELGEKATITNYIQLGNAKLYNPGSNEDKVLESGGIIIYDNGIAKFGGIEINGANSEISGTNFSITPDRATFSNVSVSGTIETTVFKQGSFQAAGGSMLFMPSFKIEKVAGNILYLDQDISSYLPEEDGEVWVLTKEGSYQKISTISRGTNDQGPYVELKAGYDISNTHLFPKQDLLIGINSNESKILDDKIYGLGLTINKADNIQGKPNLFLGDLNQLGLTGYGLYSDNVYLNGSLTTQAGENSYAGVNTLNGVNATQFSADDSKIIFWAGANSTEDKAIQQAPFQVTEDGSIYASRAKLTNTLIVGGSIESAELHTAKIYGTGEDDLKTNKVEPALSIYNAGLGIEFKGIDEYDEEFTTLRISESGLVRGDSTFISFADGVHFLGDTMGVNKGTNSLQMTYEDSTPVLKHRANNNNCGFYFEIGKTVYKIDDKDQICWKNGETSLYGSTIFEDEKGVLEYKPVNGGYDLYITERKEENNNGN